ncbi:MAG: sigma-E processing peptidase SpoIIGA [Eubacterium sp.]|nr:sigma-E processing peptidase SpoIIGA [Eubacterium sp.]
MVCYIYLDVYFAFNMLMDFLVLWILRIWEQDEKGIRYCCLASVIGGIYAVVMEVLNVVELVQWILTYWVMGQVLVVISLKWRGIQRHLSRVISLYMGMFFLCGMLVVVADLQNKRRGVYRATGMVGEIDGKLCVGLALIVGSMFYCLIGRLKQTWQIRKHVETVELLVGKSKKRILALCDTGNCLREPITGKPACVISAASVKDIEIEKIIFIPYNTIDRENGILQGFWAERLSVCGNAYENVPVAVHHGGWERSSGYEMILHPKYFEEGGVAYDCRKRKDVLDRKMESV